MIYRLTTAILIMLFGCLAFVSHASAGDYNVVACHASNDSSKSNAFTAFQNGSGWTNFGQGDCGALGFLWVARINNSIIPVESWSEGSAGFTLTAPADTGFTGLNFDWFLESQGWGNRCIQATASWAHRGGYCHNVGSNSGGISPGGALSDPFSIGWQTSSETFAQSQVVNLSVRCTSDGGAGGCSGSRPSGSTTSTNTLAGYFKNISAQIHDPTAPSLIDGGGLWGQTGWVSGNWDLSWNATDSMGVKRHRFLVDDVEKGAGASFCDLPSYLGRYFGPKTKPCPSKDESGYQGASFTVDTTALSDGEHTLKIQSYDATDNIGEASTTINVDNTAPTMNSVFGTNPWTNDTTPTVTFSGADSQSGVGGYQCAVDGGSYGDCSNPYTTTALSDGDHSVCAKAYSKAVTSSGGRLYSTVECHNFSISTVPPTASLSNPGSWLGQGTTIAGNAFDNISGLSQVKIQTGSNGTWQDLCSYDSSGPYSCQAGVASLTDGQSYSVRLLATNNAGTSVASTSYTATVDKSPPTPPAVSSGPSEGSWIATNSASLSFSATDAGIGVDGYSCRLDGGSWGACASPKSYTSLSDGSHTLDVKAADKLNQESSTTSRTFSVDTINPDATIDPLPDYVSGVVAIDGSTHDYGSGIKSSSLKLEAKLGGGSYSSICTPSWSLINWRASCSWNTTSLAEGNYAIRFSTGDNAGNSPAPASKNVVVDNSAPVVAIVSQTRYPVWSLSDSLSGIDTSKTIAEYSTNGSVWNELNYFSYKEDSGQFSASFSDSVATGSSVSVRLKGYNRAGVLRQVTSNYIMPKTPPQAQSQPGLSGTTRVGQTLSGSSGSWSGLATISYNIEWLRCNQDGSGCLSVSSGANRIITDGDANKRLKLRVTATNGDGSTVSDSALSDIISGLPASALNTPTISGTLKASQQVQTSNGNWNGTPPFTFAYQWLRCSDTTIASCQEITGATESGYEMTSVDIDKRLRSRVSANNTAILGGGSATQTSEVSALISASPPSGSGSPSVAGSLYDRRPLSASDGTWFGSRPFNYSYQWQYCDGDGNNCLDYDGATEATFSPPESLVGKTVQVKVKADNSAMTGGGVAEQVSSPTSIIQRSKASNSYPPTISGIAAIKQTLTVNTGSWQGFAPFEYRYQWQRCSDEGCLDIDGATTADYQVVSADSGLRLRALVAASNFAGETTALTANSNPVTRAIEPPVNSLLPLIEGAFKAGQNLSVNPGSWSGYGTITYNYTWYRCLDSSSCQVVRSGTSQYLLGDNDVGKRVMVAVKAKNEDGEVTVQSALSETVATVKPQGDALPIITGQTKTGEKLSIVAGGWRGESPMTVGYTWYRCVSRGDCVELNSGESFNLTDQEVGRYIMVKETATNRYGSGDQSSGLVGPVESVSVKKPPTLGMAPTLSGINRVGQSLRSGQGLWGGLQPMSFQYSWQRCAGGDCSDIAGANGENYRLQTGDAGKKIRSRIGAANADGNSDGFSALSDTILNNDGSTPADDTSQCLSLAAVVAGKVKLGQALATFPGRSAGRYQNKAIWTIKADKKKMKGVKVTVLLDKRAVKTKQSSKTISFTLTSGQLRPGKHILAMTLVKKKQKKQLIRTITSQTCK